MKSKVFIKATSFLLALGLLAGCAPQSQKVVPDQTTTDTEVQSSDLIAPVSNQGDVSLNVPGKRTEITKMNEIRGIWISYLEMKTMLEKKTKAEFTKNIVEAYDNIVGMGLNTVYVQVRPFGDALYKSDYFPWSHTITGVEGKDPGFDPLDIMVTEAHSRGLLVEAWINPYRVRPDKVDNKALCTDNQASQWLKAKDRSVIQQGKLISYNPASTKAQDLIVNGVKEIVKNYDVDGIHIDDYFYPISAASFDKIEYDAYKAGGGSMSQASWRRNNVETLLKKMYLGIKSVKPNVKFGISPQSNIDTNFSTQYLDIAKITSTTGYCDYIAPQIYFGFNNSVQPYKATLDKWEKIIKESKIDLYVGLANYKIGAPDGKAGNNEWVNSKEIISRQIEYARALGRVSGFILYRYDHIFKPEKAVKTQVEQENQKIRELLS